MKKVYLFATCVGMTALSDTVLSAIALLRREGVEVIFKKKQTCCGQPSFNSGYFDETKEIAMHNISLFSEDYPIVVPSGSCAGMMSHDYLELFRDDPRLPIVQKFASRVIELSQYLNDVLHVKYEDKGEPIKVTWHTSCHSLRVQHSSDSNKALLAKLKNVELVPLPHEAECCGFGGTFSVKEKEISNAIVSEKINNIKKTNTRVVLTADGACLMNIKGAIEKQHEDIKIMHLYEFVYKRITGEAL